MDQGVILNKIAEYNMLNGSFCSDNSLIKGKIGISIFFFEYAKYTQSKWYEEYAGDLLDDVCNNIYKNIPINFADGLCGIGWAIEFLKKNEYVEVDSDDVLEHIDAKVMERDLMRISDKTLSEGLDGVLAYVCARISSKREKIYQPFDHSYIRDYTHQLFMMNKKYDVENIWTKVLSIYSATDISNELDWRKGLVLLSKHKV